MAKTVTGSTVVSCHYEREPQDAFSVDMSTDNVIVSKDTLPWVDIYFKVREGSELLKYGDRWGFGFLGAQRVQELGMTWTFFVDEDNTRFVLRVFHKNLEVNESFLCRITVDGSIIFDRSLSMTTVKHGENGADAVTYEIFTATPCVEVDADGTAHPNVLTWKSYRITGSKREALNDGYEVWRVGGDGTKVKTSLSGSMSARYATSNSPMRLELVESGKGESYTTDDVLAATGITVSRDGTQGAFVSIIFKRSATKPKTKPSGGTFDKPLPTDTTWTDAPSGDDSLPLWMSRAKFTVAMTGKTGAPTPEWSEPTPVADSNDMEIIWNPQANPPAPEKKHPYTTGKDGWTKSADNAVWMAIAQKTGGAWGEWDVVKVKGETGEAAVSIDITPGTILFNRGHEQSKEVMISCMVGSTPTAPDSVTVSNIYEGLAISSSLDLATESAVLTIDYDGESKVEANIAVTIRVKGKDYIRTIGVVSVSDGAQGAITSVTEWARGKKYRNGKEADENGLRVLNIVYKGALGKRQYYVCIQDHYPSNSTDNEPGSGSRWTEYWVKMTNVGPIFTEFLLADNAHIDLLDSQEIVLWHTDDNGNPVMDARIGPPTTGNGGTIAWFGGNNPDDATTRIEKDGSVYCNKGVFEGDVVFGGRIRPLRTVITSANWEKYLHREIVQGVVVFISVDYTKLSGCVIFDSSMNSVNLGASIILNLPGIKNGTKLYNYGIGASVDDDLNDIVGNRIRIINRMSKKVAVSGQACLTDGSLEGTNSYDVATGYETHLVCKVGAGSSGKKNIAWVREYLGSE